MEKLILIDGNSLINRAFYATPPMSNSKGVPTNAVLGFVNMLLRLINSEKPNYMLVAFDRKEPTFRHKMFDGYKATRKPMPDDLRPQIQLLKDVLDSMAIPHFELAGSEADDIIGTASKKYPVQTVIVTGDRDSFQLVDDTTEVHFTKRGITDIDVLSKENFTEKTSLTPSQIIDLKALMGDKSDNIPGIAGIGEKTALDLILKYGNVEGLYDHTEELKGKLKEKIILGREMCMLSKDLATINLNVPLNLSLEDLKISTPFPASARHMFADLEFRTLMRKEELFLEEENLPAKGGDVLLEIVLVKSETEIKNLYGKTLAVYLGDDISLSDGNGEYLVKIKQTFFDEGFTYEEALNLIKSIFEEQSSKVIVFSRKKTERKLYDLGVNVNADVEDVSLKKYIVDFSGKEESLQDVMLFYHMPETHTALSLFKLNSLLDNALEENNQTHLYRDIELPLSKVLFDMEIAGFKVDETIINELNLKYKKIIDELTEKIYESVGERFNINSPKQLGVILFEKLNLYHGKKKGNYSTSAEVLEELVNDHEVIPLILQYRRVSKLNSTYVEGFKNVINKRTGMIHTVFNQTLTATGRLSSKEPNLQNLPIRDEEGREIRKFFIPSGGDRVLIGADYSQIELRLLAHFSGCEKLVKAYKDGEDIHSLTASQVFGVPIEGVTKEMRRKAKAVNFGIIYGISDYGLAKNIKISPKEAKEYISKYFESYPEVKAYMDENVRFARENGYVSTLCGRKRFIRDINSPNFNLRSFSERAAMNMPLQGSSADIIKIAMVRVYNRLKKENLQSRLILQVHDELVIDALKEEKEVVEKLLVEEMENAVSLNVPLTVESYCGNNLFEAK